MSPPHAARLAATVMAVVAAVALLVTAPLGAGWPPPISEWLYAALGLTFPALGWLIASRRPGNAFGWLLLADAVCLGLGSLGAVLLAGPGGPIGPAPLTAALSPLLSVFFGLSWVFVPLLFPDGRLPSRRWRPVAWIGAVSIGLHWLGTLLLTGSHRETILAPAMPLPESGIGVFAVVASALGQGVTFIVSLVVLGSLVTRWRRGGTAERRQLRWLFAGITVNLAGFGLLGAFVVDRDTAGVTSLGVFLVVGALPAGIGVAVVRHGLLDIRLTIRGSRLYLVFDVRPTVGELLSRLGPTLAEAEPAEQLGRLAHAVRAGLDVRWAAIALADGTRVVAGQEKGEPAVTLPVGGTAGHLVCGPKLAGRFTAEDRRLLGALAVPVGLAIQSAGLAARLVNAQEAERRRIERNIHDGVQQHLVALIAGLELARAAGGGPDTLALLREQARQALHDLRELAAGIHPSVLGQGGVVEAVEERCSRLPIAATVTSDPGLHAKRFSDEIEGAVYFTVSEAVANALKHACATAIDVALSLDDGNLRVSVADDGRGFTPTMVPRGGLAMLADRLAALGGGLDVDSVPGAGARVRAWVPAHA